MQNIRRGTFETNSSSTHSISIDESCDEMFDTIIPNSDGIIELNGGEFGWQEEEFNDALTKANYCYVDNIHDPKKLEELISVISQQTCVKPGNIRLNASTEYSGGNWSYVDHQSQGTSLEAFESFDKLTKFIFNPRSVLRTDNDNH